MVERDGEPLSRSKGVWVAVHHEMFAKAGSPVFPSAFSRSVAAH
jgi:hypothetical protein